MADTLYPFGYGTTFKTMAELRPWLLVHHHPEYVRRLCAWLESKGGTIGIGGGWRLTQPVKDGAAPEGMSFHQDQHYADGFVGACAVDLVARSPIAGSIHISVTWAQVPRQGGTEAARWGVHANVDQGTTTEPWHIQPVEIDGYMSWVNAGRPAPKPNYPLPTDPNPGAVNWNPDKATVDAVKDAPPVAETLQNKWNDWALIAFLKTIQETAGLPVTGKYDQATANFVDATVA